MKFFVAFFHNLGKIMKKLKIDDKNELIASVRDGHSVEF